MDPIDLDALRAALQSALPGCADGRLELRGLRLLKARRSASRRRHPHPLTLHLEGSWLDRATGRAGLQTLYARSHREGMSAAAYDEARRAPAVEPDFGAAVAHVPALELVVWAWPNDPGLPQLPRLLDASHWPAGCTGPVEVIHHEPADRATLRCASPEGAIYAKNFATPQAPALRERFEWFARAARRDVDAPLVARPCAMHADGHTLWQHEAPGAPLAEQAQAPHARAAFAAAGRALAHLHAAVLPTHCNHSPEHWRGELQRRGRKIGRAVPDLAARADRLVDALVDASHSLPEREPTLIHGDFHVGQVGWHDGRIVLFDFDEFALGDPMEDVAAFEQRLDRRLAPEDARGLGAAFVDAYRHAAPHRFDWTVLRWQRALQALLQASRAFVFQVDGWPGEVERRLARAEALWA